MAVEVRIPTLGESITEGVIVAWRKTDGERVRPDEILFELETDKASVEIPTEVGGVLTIVRREGETVAVGDVVARIDQAIGTGRPEPHVESPRSAMAAASGADANRARTQAEPGRDRPGLRPLPAARHAPSAGTEEGAARRPVGPLSPAVRRLIGEHELDPTRIPATGRGGRLTAEDIHTFLDRRPDAPATTPTARAAGAPADTPASEPPAAPPPVEAPSAPEGEVRAPMSRLRKRIAERLVRAQHTAAILTTFNEVDMSAVLALRTQHRERFREAHGVDLGLLSFFARATVAGLAEFPSLNAEISGDDIVTRRFVHLGIAVSTPQGLVVPVLPHAQRMSFAEFERGIARLAARARDGKLSLDELSHGTFTITNGGVFGSLLSTPILNPPQSGILGLHKIEKRPVAIEDQVAIRPMMYVALSYDHRIVDGEQAVTFLVRVKQRIEDPARLLLDV
jgi:2-oxoglutarate dehydrogenase E2 component (dihydrolipoamide succinyltransferase)